jgi:ATP-binding cassette subfamily B protein
MAPERRRVAVALCAVVVTSASALVAPLIVARIVDTYIANGVFAGVIGAAAVLLVVYLLEFCAGYVQREAIGEVGARIRFDVRNELFEKAQKLPVAFFNQNRSGDLISRINNDTDRLHQFFAYGLIHFLRSALLIAGTGVMVVSLHAGLGLATLGPAIVALVVTQLLGGWVKQRSLEGLGALGNLSSEVQECLANFKVIAAFSRVDYFRKRVGAANEANFEASTRAGIAGNVLIPLYGLANNIGVLALLAVGVWLVARGAMTTGLLIAYLLYLNSFYQSLLQFANVWSSFQLALAALDRISQLLVLESDLGVAPAEQTSSKAIMEFRSVSFGYSPGKEVLHHIDFTLERGKKYAIVGPTGGGKSTIASLMARLYDPSEGRVLLAGRDIRSHSAADRARRIGFIPQEPFLFSGTVGDNIVYGNLEYRGYTREALEAALDELGLLALLDRFGAGLDSAVASDGDSMSLGQKQLIAFMRAVLRRPELLILDEATASIDTVTEQLLETILARLPGGTTKVVVAHRLNTIKKADEILFVNAGKVIRAGSMEHAIGMLLHEKMAS